MSHNIIIIAGRDRSGKSILSTFLKDNFGYQIFELGAFARKEFHADDSKREVTISEYYQKNMSKIDYSILKALKKTLKDSSKICIVGVRTLDLLNNIKQCLSNCTLVYIESDQDLRLERHLKILSERMSEGINTPSIFLKNDEIQTTWGIEFLKEISDVIIENNHTKKAFFEASIDKLQLM